jgi:hypothetical protein
MKIKLQIPDWSILVTLAATTIYFVFRNLGREIGSFAFLWAPLTLLIIIYKRPAIFTKGSMRVLLLYGAIMVGILQYTLWSSMNDWNRKLILLEFYFIVIMTAILFYYWSSRELWKLAYLSKWAFIFIIVTLITTNVALYFDPNLVRQSASTGVFTDYQKKIYDLTGAMSYSYVQAIICLIPILIYHIKGRKKMVFAPNVLVVILMLIFITLIRSQVFANVLVAVFITVLSIIGSKKRWISVITISVFVFLFTIIPNSYYVDAIKYLGSKFNQDSEMYYKLNDFAEFISDPEFDTSTAAGSRAERYPMLFKALLANPILGDASYKNNIDISAGGHLYWMNKLALWGIPGFLFFIFVLTKILRRISTLFDAGYRFYYFLSILAIIFLGLIKVIGGREQWLVLIVIIPGLYYLPLLAHYEKKVD